MITDSTSLREPTDREVQNQRAIGGMRNPHLALQRLTGLTATGDVVRSLLEDELRAKPELLTIGRDILTGREASPLPAEVTAGLRTQVLAALGGPTGPRARTAKANTPIDANVIQAWGSHSGG